MPRKSPSVVLVGRPNVGKSTLFNRMTGSRRAIVAPDGRHDARFARAAGRPGAACAFQLFDTGGLYGASEDPLHELVVQQGQRAIAGADLLVFLVDGREGLVSGDETIARELRETGLPGAARHQQDRRQARAQPARSEFYQLGFEPVIEISAEHGTASATARRDRRAARGRRAASSADRRRRLRRRRSPPVPSRRAPTRRRSETTRRHRRPAERREVVAGQPAAEARSACSSATCRARRAMRSTPR